MQVRILPAAPLPGGVKVARRFVKPFGVGASPTLAANFNFGFTNDDLRACGKSRAAQALVNRKSEIVDLTEHCPVAQKQSTRLISERTRSITVRDNQPSLKLRLGEPFRCP